MFEGYTSEFNYAWLSCGTIAKEVKKRGFEVAPRTVWKVLTAQGYSQCRLTVKPGLNKLNKATRLAWCLEREHWTLEQWKTSFLRTRRLSNLGEQEEKEECEGSLVKLTTNT